MYFSLGGHIIVVSKHLLEKSNMKLFKNLSTKNILRTAIVVLIFCWIFVFDAHFGVNVRAKTTQWWITSIWVNEAGITGINVIDAVLQIIYMIFYPLIFLAGLAIDNSLIYWEVFHLDVPLWRFRNIVKNLANFTLWFMVLFTILKNVFSIGEKVWEVKKIVTKTLIAGVLIQASWFLTAAIIDISTVATYGVWALPMSVLKWTKIWDQKILAVDSKMDIDVSFDKNQAGQAFKTAFRVKYNWEDILLAPCMLKRNWTGDNTKTYIVWRKYYESVYKNYGKFGGPDTTACVANAKQIVIYNEPVWLKDKEWSDYESDLNWMLNITDTRRHWESCGNIINIRWNWEIGNECDSYAEYVRNYYNSKVDEKDRETEKLESMIKKPRPTDKFWFKWWEKWFKSEEVEAMTIWQLVDRSKWLVWPMMTIFSSMMNFAQISETSQDNWVWAVWMETLIKALFAIAIFFPLLALTLVLVARVGVLWLVVAASPFIILLKVFKEQLWSIWDIANKADLSNIIKIIFSPVIVVFALSMSIIFLQTLISSYNNTDGKNCEHQKAMWESMMITPIYTAEQEAKNECKTDEYVFLDWLVKIKANWTFDWSGTGDLLSRTIINIVAIALVWMLLFAAIKASWKLWESIWKWVEEFWSSMLKTLPILKLPWLDKNVWIWTASSEIFGWDRQAAVWNRMVNNEQEEQFSKIKNERDKDEWKYNNTGASNSNTSANKKNESVITYITNPTTSNPNLNELNQGRQGNDIIAADYMTNTKNLEELEKLQWAIKEDRQKINALTWLVSLLASSIDEKAKNVKSKDELVWILQPIYDAKDNISIKYIDWLIASWKKFEIEDWWTKRKYIVKKDASWKPELVEDTTPPTPAPTPNPAPTTP